MSASPSLVDGTIGYTGCTDHILQPMVNVNVTDTPLLEGQTFPDKETLLMRIAEEANLYGVWIKIVCSDGFQDDVKGADWWNPFHVLGYYCVTALKWKVTKCITRNAGRMAYVLVEKGRK